MTRLLCTADLHIGAGSDHRGDALADQEHVLDQIVEQARAHDVDAVLVAGDVFHRPKPAPAELHVFSRFARNLERAAIPTIAILGNAGHDQLGADLPSALELFQSDWLRVSRAPELVKAAGDVAVVTLPSVPVSRLVALRGGGDRTETNELAATLLVEAAAELRAQVPEGWPCVLIGHWSASGASLPNGLPVATLTEPVLPIEELEAQRWDAIVLGHIHKGQRFGSHPFGRWTALYCGSPMTQDFGEGGFEHGVWLLDLEELSGESDALPEFVPLTDRRFVTVNADLTNVGAAIEITTPEDGFDRRIDMDETDYIAALITEELPLTDAVVRVSYRATEEQHRRVDAAALTGFLDEAGVHKLYGGIKWEPVKGARARVEGMDEQLDPLAAVDAWCKANDVDDTPGLQLARLTTSYLEGETS